MHLPRFEQISALKHHCGVCKTPFSNPNALSTCVGKHEVICANYHFMFHFVGKAHTCKACIKTEQQQEKRHRAILVMLQEYRKENGEDDVDHSEAPTASPFSDGLKKKDRKAQKKAAKSVLKLQIITQADLAELHAIIYPTDGYTEDADKVLADALSVKCLPNLLHEKRMLDTLMAPPKLKPNPETEADRVIAACEVSEPQNKTAKMILEKIRTAIKEDIDVQWKTEFEMKKRRIIYAQWITQGAVDQMALHYEDWDINTGARTNRRYKGDERGAKGQDKHDIFEDDLDYLEDSRFDITTDFKRRISLHSTSDVDTPTRSSPLAETEINVEKKSPLNDRRRGGNILHQSSPVPESHQAWDDENYLTTPKATAPILRIVASTSKRRETSPWGGIVKPKPLDLSVQPPVTPTQSRRQSMPVHTFDKYASAVDSSPQVAWNRASLSHVSEISPTRPDGAVYDVLESIPSPKVAHAIRVLPKQIPIDTFADEEHGDWATVGKKGKPRPMNIGRLRK